MNARDMLQTVLVEKLGLSVDLDSLPLDQSIQDMGMDSLVLVKLIYTLEDEFGITLKTKEILEINTYGQLLDLLESKRATV